MRVSSLCYSTSWWQRSMDRVSSTLRLKSRSSPLSSSAATSSPIGSGSASFSVPKNSTSDEEEDRKLLSSAVQRVVRERRSCKRFDVNRPVDPALLENILRHTLRAPTGLNLQPWTAVVVPRGENPLAKKKKNPVGTDQEDLNATHAALHRAVLLQPQVATAPFTIVFAGDKEPERYANANLELSLESGYYRPSYGPVYLRHVYYLLHGGPCDTLGHAKRFLSARYSEATGTPLVSVPESKQAYAWKQTMIAATTFVHLATAAGLDTAMMEGLDEVAVRNAVGLPDRFTVPVVISVGYGDASNPNSFHNTPSPRFAYSHMIRWGKY